MVWFTARAWWLYLVFGALVVAPYWAVSPGASNVLWALLGWSSVAAVVYGVRLHRPAARLPWYLLAACLAMFIIGDNIYSYQTVVLHSEAYPSLADLFYLGMYPFGIAGLALLVRRRDGGRDRASIVDTTIVTTSLGVLSWVFLISPNVHGDAGVFARLVSAAYPLMDIALLAVAARLAFSGGKRLLAFRLLVLASVGMLVSDALYGYVVLEGSWYDQNPIDVGWIGFYLLWGAAALHPSMARITDAPDERALPRRRRIYLIGAAAIGPSLLQLLRPIDHASGAIALATIAMFTLALVRLSWLARAVAGNEIETRYREAALRAAEEHSRQKSVFLANMSHEVRTPLNGVMGMVDLLRQTTLDVEQRDYADTLADSAQYLAALVNDVLDFSRIEAGKLDVESEPFDLRLTVDAAMNVGSARAREKGLELVAIVDRDVPNTVVGDHIRMRQILGNLVSNATKFTNAGHVVVNVRLDGADVVFAVSDTGIGLADEGREKLFEQFVQADDSTTRRFHGSGLGLAISKQLVTLMGGEIGVESERGAGSTFWFRIPLRCAPHTDHTVRPPRLAGRRVLLVTSSELVAAALSRVVEHWGVDCVVDSNAERALVLAATPPGARQYDVVIVDECIGESRQRALAEKVRRDPEAAGTRVVALTATRHASGEPGDPVDAWITKPVRSANLYDCLESLLCEREALSAPSDGDEGESVERRVLVVEDNLVNQKVATALLGQLGYVTAVAGDGVDALRLVETESFDAILMDCQMPRMDGYEATMEIRRREQGRRTPIIAMTASALYSDRERCLTVGMDEYLTKPINRDALAETLVKFLAVASA